MKNLKKFKYVTYLTTSAFLIAFGLLGVIFIAVDSTTGFDGFADVFEKSLRFENTQTGLGISGTILLYDGFVAVFISILVQISIATDIYATKGDRAFLLTGLIPLFGNIHAVIRIFRDSSLSIEQAAIIEETEVKIRTAILEETKEIRAHKIDQNKAIKVAEANKVFVTISKRKNRETKIVERVWSCIDHKNRNKTIFKTKKEALTFAAKVTNPKKMIIHNANGKFEYWLTYIDDSNIPMVKAPKRALAEFESGENEVLKLLGVKAVAKKAPTVKAIARKEAKATITREIKIADDKSKITNKEKKAAIRNTNRAGKRAQVLDAPVETKVVTKVVKVVKTDISENNTTLKEAKSPIIKKDTIKKIAAEERRAAEEKEKKLKNKKAAANKKAAVVKKKVATKKVEVAAAKKTAATKKVEVAAAKEKAATKKVKVAAAKKKKIAATKKKPVVMKSSTAKKKPNSKKFTETEIK